MCKRKLPWAGQSAAKWLISGRFKMRWWHGGQICAAPYELIIAFTSWNNTYKKLEQLAFSAVSETSKSIAPHHKLLVWTSDINPVFWLREMLHGDHWLYDLKDDWKL